jgi:hypothetical protein
MDTASQFCPSCGEPRSRPQRPGRWKPQRRSAKFLGVIVVLTIIGGVVAACGSGEEKTPTTASGASSAEAAYVADVVPILDQANAALETVGDIMPMYPDLVTAEQAAEFTAALETLQAMEGQLSALEVPPGLADAHEHLLSCAAQYKQASILVGEGLDQSDPSKLDTAMGLFSDGSAQLEVGVAGLPH